MKWLIGAGVVVVAVLLFLESAWNFGRSSTENVTVCIRELEKSSKGTVEYRIQTDKNGFTLDKAKYDGVLNGHTYTITYSGWKLDAFGAYPTVEDIKPVEPADKEGLLVCGGRKSK